MFFMRNNFANIDVCGVFVAAVTNFESLSNRYTQQNNNRTLRRERNEKEKKFAFD